MSEQAKVPDDDPRMVAWKEYMASEEYANSFQWARHEEHRDGSLWSAFIQGWEAADEHRGGADPMTDRPKERVAREIERAMHEVWTKAGSPPWREIEALAEELDLEALRSGGEEAMTLGDFIGWMRENNLVIVHREDSSTPTTETDAPGEGGDIAEWAERLGSQVVEAERRSRDAGARPDPDEGSGEGERLMDALEHGFRWGYEAGAEDEEEDPGMDVEAGQSLAWDIERGDCLDAFLAACSRPEPTVEGDGALPDGLETLALDLEESPYIEPVDAENIGRMLREAARRLRLRESPEGEKVEGWAWRDDSDDPWIWEFYEERPMPGGNHPGKPATLIIHEPTREEGEDG